MNNLEIVIELPAWRYTNEGEHAARIWTNDPSLNLVPVEPDSKHRFLYMPQVMMHEFGHSLGLSELNLKRFDRWLMGPPREEVGIQAIPSTDIEYLRDVYKGHTPHR